MRSLTKSPGACFRLHPPCAYLFFSCYMCHIDMLTLPWSCRLAREVVTHVQGVTGVLVSWLIAAPWSAAEQSVNEIYMPMM